MVVVVEQEEPVRVETVGDATASEGTSALAIALGGLLGVISVLGIAYTLHRRRRVSGARLAEGGEGAINLAEIDFAQLKLGE
jgi:hypothetical protein